MKKILNISAIIIIILVGLLVGRNLIAKAAIKTGVGLTTGLKLDMNRINIDLVKTAVEIHGLRLFNPKGYVDKVMVDLPEVYVDISLKALLKGKIHLWAVRVYLRELMVVKNEKGQLNVDSLRAVKAAKKQAAKPKAQQKPSVPGSMKVDALKLRIDKVVYKDYMRGPNPLVQEFNINLNESYSGIDNLPSVASLILVKALMRTSVGALANLNLDPLENSVSGALSSSARFATNKAANAAGQAVAKVPIPVLQETVAGIAGKTKSLTQSLGGSVGSLKDKLELPSGKSE
jgi:hypothetical protein